jgi:hypothetical protein
MSDRPYIIVVLSSFKTMYTTRTTGLYISKLCILPTGRIYAFRMAHTINSDTSLNNIALSTGDVICFL